MVKSFSMSSRTILEKKKNTSIWASFGGMHANELWLRQHFLLSQVWVEGKGVGSNAAGSITYQ